MGCRTLLLLSIALSVITQAQAEFRLFMENPDAVSVQQRTALIVGEQTRYADAPLFLQRGVAGEARVVLHSGNQVALTDALRGLLPSGWTATVHPAWRDYAVTWSSGMTWLEVLKEIAQRIGADVLVDWSQRQVVFDPAVRQAWVLEAGSLRANLERWANRAGWHLRWEVRGYRDLSVPIGAVLPLGASVQEAMAQVVDSYRRGQVVNLKAEFFESNLTVVLRCDAGGC